MSTPRFTHIALHVNDIDACVHFYQRYCHMIISRERHAGDQRIVWMAEPGREHEFVFVLMSGGSRLNLSDDDYRHFGFAVASRSDVDEIAMLARQSGELIWPPREEPYPVGYYCGLCDPNGNYVEFSYGQPLGFGAQE